MLTEAKSGLMIGLYWGVVALNIIALILNIRVYRKLMREKQKYVSQRLQYVAQMEMLDKELDKYFVMYEKLKQRLFEQDMSKQTPFRCHGAAGYYSKAFYEEIEEKWRREDAEDDRAEDGAQE